MSETIQVVKLGGSLLEMPDLANVLRRWLATQRPAKSIFIVGGGAWTDAVRQADSNHRLGEEPSHWLCIRALSVTARLLAALLPEAALIDSFDELRCWKNDPSGQSITIFELESFLRDHEPALAPAPLPHTWEVTTDSLAGRLAEILDSDLVLLKACNPPLKHDLGAWSREGYIDSWLPQIALRLRSLRTVNLRRFADMRVP
jgi:aspartokinase-like uncharacterized kinase